MNNKNDTQLLKGLAELAILAALSKRTQYGLELLSEVSVQAGIHLGEGSIYPLLHRLQKDKLIVSEWRLNTPSGRPRKYYKCTKLGRAALSEKINSWRSIRKTLDEYLKGLR